MVLGNELNDPKEYPGCNSLEECGQNYASQYSVFAQAFTGPNLSPAPPNTSHAERDAQVFITAAQQAYRHPKTTFLAAIAYRLNSCAYEEIRCSQNSFQWLSNQFPGKPIILVEYGLHPFLEDNDLEAVKSFLTNELPQDQNVIAITPLVRNSCGSGWLRFNCRDFVDQDGEIIQSRDEYGYTPSPINPNLPSSCSDTSAPAITLPACSITLDPKCGKRLSGLHPQIQAAFQSAADKYKMPVNLLVGIAIIESRYWKGGGLQDLWDLTDTEVQELTKPWNGTPQNSGVAQATLNKVNCSPNHADASGPLQMTPPAFDPSSRASAGYGGRPSDYRGHVCNITDAAFAAADFLVNKRLPYFGFSPSPDWSDKKKTCAAGKTYYGSCQMDSATCGTLGNNYCDFLASFTGRQPWGDQYCQTQYD